MDPTTIVATSALLGVILSTGGLVYSAGRNRGRAEAIERRVSVVEDKESELEGDLREEIARVEKSIADRCDRIAKCLQDIKLAVVRLETRWNGGRGNNPK